ncbi:hypothetical protein, partial [Henriciella sp.]|uniref:hypothetical protein n=1 Tax=Henriciella sp. TaxID=1968823 RepID=UPI00261F826A
MSKNKREQACDVRYELSEAVKIMAATPADFAAGAHPQDWLLRFDIDGLRTPAGRQPHECIEIVEYLAKRSTAWVERELAAKQTAKLAKDLLKLESQAGLFARSLRALTSDDLRILLTLVENDEIQKHPALAELEQAIGREEFLPVEPVTQPRDPGRSFGESVRLS